jgi:hypothetical protein
MNQTIPNEAKRSRLGLGAWIVLGAVITGAGLYVWIWTRLPK